MVADRPGEVAVFPELAAPQSLLDLWKLPKHRPRRKTLEPRHHLRYRVARRERAEQVHVVGADLHLIYRDVGRVGYLPKHLTDPCCERPFKNAVAALRRPDQGVLSDSSGVRTA